MSLIAAVWKGSCHGLYSGRSVRQAEAATRGDASQMERRYWFVRSHLVQGGIALMIWWFVVQAHDSPLCPHMLRHSSQASPHGPSGQGKSNLARFGNSLFSTVSFINLAICPEMPKASRDAASIIY